MEPERKIEKLLRAYAKKRRAEAGDSLKLHPANRRLLQSEAARRAPEASPKREPGEGNLFSLLFAVFRRRLAFIVCVAALIAVGVALLQPAGTSKKKVQSLEAATNLRQIGMATRRYAEDNMDVLPASLDEVTNELGTSKVLIDPATGKPFVYTGAGKRLDSLQSNTLLAYSLADEKDHAVLFADGRVETVTGARLTELTNQKPVEFALADKSGREQSAETPSATAPVASATAALPPPTPERAKMTQAKDQFNTADLGMNAPSAAEPAKRQPELAQSELKKTEPVATPAPIGAVGGRLGGVGQTIAVNGSISGKLPATDNFEALAQNRSFNRLVAQTNSGQLSFATSQNFVQAGVSSVQNLFKNSVAPAQATPVLQSFQVQQNGNVISIVDRDGSVYHGSVQPGTAMVRNEPAAVDTFAPPGALPQSQTKATPSAGNVQQAAQNYFFHVAGMNRTLKQNVVFTGNLLANSSVPQMAQSSNSFGGFGGGGGGGGSAGNQLQQAAANQSQQSLLWNSRIVGTAVIAKTNQVEINAVPITQ
jgi:hypothetical protein